MSITLIHSRRRLAHKKTYKSPKDRKRKSAARLSHQERAQRNRDKKRARLDKLKNKNKPKSRKPKKSKMPYRFKYYQFLDYKFKSELDPLEKIDSD